MTMRNSQRKGRAALAALAALVALAGCDRIGNPFVVLGSKPPAPDEFQVITRKPLRMPPSVALPEPRPGTPSPLDPTPERDAELALLGTVASPGGTAPTSGEEDLLAAATSASSAPVADGRAPSPLESDLEAANDEYVPPSIFELLGATEAPPEDVIDPAAEARRLQGEGVATPTDPNDRPAIEEVVVVEPSPYPEVGTDDRPNNRPLSTVEPAFE